MMCSAATLRCAADYVAERAEADAFIGMVEEEGRRGRGRSAAGGASAASPASSQPPASAGGGSAGRGRVRRRAPPAAPAGGGGAQGPQQRQVPPGALAQDEQQLEYSAALEHKQRGNELYRLGKYKQAARHYSSGAAACAAGLAGGQMGAGAGADAGSQRIAWEALAVDCHNNRAQALIKLAEVAGSDSGGLAAADSKKAVLERVSGLLDSCLLGRAYPLGSSVFFFYYHLRTG